MQQNSRVLVLGARGMVGSAVVRELRAQGFADILSPSSQELNLFEQEAVRKYFLSHKPNSVFFAAARVGGILANDTYRADFLLENLQMEVNTYEAAFKADVKTFIFFGSSCIYPKMASQPMGEKALLTGELEPTNEPYAIAKIAGLKLAENFRRQYGKTGWIALMPTNLYGVNDRFDEKNSHVIPGLIHRMERARKNNEPMFEVWGTGSPRREFLYVDDLAKASVFVARKAGETELPYWMNVGTGEDMTIKDLAQRIAVAVGYRGEIVFNPKFPDGTPRKLLDVSLMKSLGWRPEISFDEGLRRSVEYYRSLGRSV